MKLSKHKKHLETMPLNNKPSKVSYQYLFIIPLLRCTRQPGAHGEVENNSARKFNSPLSIVPIFLHTINSNKPPRALVRRSLLLKPILCSYQGGEDSDHN